MKEDVLPLYSRGDYHVVMLRRELPGDAAGWMQRYAVVTSAGLHLREETSFDDARAWVDRHLHEQTRSARPAARSGCRRRR